MFKRLIIFLSIFAFLVLSACSYAGDDKQAKVENVKNKAFDNNIISEKLQKLTLEEKVAQLFIIVPEQLLESYDNVAQDEEITQREFYNRPVGGIIYMGNNIISPEQTRNMLKNMYRISQERIGLPPFLCVDEEGGLVARVANNNNFKVTHFEAMSVIGVRKNKEEALNIGYSMGSYLADLGFNVDFAPVADILTNSENTVIKQRAFGRDPETVRLMAAGVSQGLKKAGVLTCYKHFPGHGNTTGDTHDGYAYTNKSKTELMSCEIIPFIDAVKNDEPFIMVGHISLPKLTGNNNPASLSREVITDILRNELGYNGLIITDALNMGAINKQYSSAQACIKAIDAGVDILLMPEKFGDAYDGVLKAIKDGRLSEKRLNESVYRILKTKMKITRMKTLL